MPRTAGTSAEHPGLSAEVNVGGARAFGEESALSGHRLPRTSIRDARLGRVARSHGYAARCHQRSHDHRREQRVRRPAEADDGDNQIVAGDEGSCSRFTGIDFRNVGPGWAQRAVAQLEADVAAGAVGIGEIGKGFGQTIRKADGSRLALDDPDLDPIWQAAARLKLPVFIHTADPQEFYKPIDYHNERWLELELFPSRRIPPDRHPNFEELMKERDNLFRRNPKTTFVAAHMGWHANDLARLGRMITEMPNLYVDVGAVLYDIGRQPREAHDFFVKYQDRILFGKDSYQPEEYPYYWRVFETNDDYFDYYRPYHAFWKLYGIDLPDEVLKKVYYKNALKVTPLLPQAGWPR
ncbi:MAG TPA: amidohydrolase family protein [Gemmatimonadaceae bacterium]|nr:amidohydrolase family protein [Gemmatimonadaceae bacterium]